MIYHTSFAAGDPGHVAAVLAELVGGMRVQAPSPPFPHGSWFVFLGDQQGSLLEVLPANCAFDPDMPLGLTRRPPPSGRHAMHVLVGTPYPYATVLAVAEREGWRAQEVDTGLFAIVKVWVENRFLVEFMNAEGAARYAASLGGVNQDALDERLRVYEAELRSVLAAKIPPEILQAAVGEPASNGSASSRVK